jgi:integrase
MSAHRTTPLNTNFVVRLLSGNRETMVAQPKRRLTALKVKSLKAASASGSKRRDGRYFEWDAEIGGFGVKVTETGGKSYVLLTRYPGFKHPAPRELGSCDALTLEEAREKARSWKKLIARGVDPAEAEREVARQAAQKRKNTVEAVFVDFVADKLSQERKGKEVERDIRKEFVAQWSARPITEITDEDVLAIVRAKKRTAPAQARNLLGYANRFFDWAISQRTYGIKTNPCLGLKPAKIVGGKKARERVLNDVEVFAFWRATGRMPYPFGPLYRLLFLSGLRLNEVADAHLDEFNRQEEIWIVPASRMKGKEEVAREHVVPITTAIGRILDSLSADALRNAQKSVQRRLVNARPSGSDAGLPSRGGYIFSTNFGESPCWVSDKVKRRLDARMLRTLKAFARKRGEDPKAISLPPFVNHDLRRTLRTTLSRLRVDRDVREAVLAHAMKGIEGVYDRYDFLPEKRDALERWAAHILNIAAIDSAGAKVIPLRPAG